MAAAGGPAGRGRAALAAQLRSRGAQLRAAAELVDAGHVESARDLLATLEEAPGTAPSPRRPASAPSASTQTAPLPLPSRATDEEEQMLNEADRRREGARQLRAALRKRQPRVIPLVIEANKQDRDDALPPEELALALRVPAGIDVLAAAAAQGQGVKDVLVAASRKVAVEVQQQLADHKLHSMMGQSQTADDLFDQLLTLEDLDEHEPMETDEDYDESTVEN